MPSECPPGCCETNVHCQFTEVLHQVVRNMAELGGEVLMDVQDVHSAKQDKRKPARPQQQSVTGLENLRTASRTV